MKEASIKGFVQIFIILLIALLLLGFLLFHKFTASVPPLLNQGPQPTTITGTLPQGMEFDSHLLRSIALDSEDALAVVSLSGAKEGEIWAADIDGNILRRIVWSDEKQKIASMKWSP